MHDRPGEFFTLTSHRTAVRTAGPIESGGFQASRPTAGAQQGLAKIELAVGCLVVALFVGLVVFVFSLYSAHLVESRRAEAQIALQELRGLLEDRYKVFGRYTESGGIPPVLPFNSLPRQGGNVHYRLTLDAQTMGYTLSAVPTGSQAKDTCGTLTLNQKGETGAAHGNCWLK